MAIYPHPKSRESGPYALKHALVVLGISAEEEGIFRLARTRRSTDLLAARLRLAAGEYGCSLSRIRRLHPEGARRALLPYLRRGIPVLLRLSDPDRWVTLVRVERGKIILMDGIEPAVLNILTSGQLLRRWARDEEEARTDRSPPYDFFPVVPQFPIRTHLRLSVSRVRFLRRPENREISRLWDDYAADLLDLCKVRSPRSERVLSLGRFLARHEEMILDQVDFWHGALDGDRARKVLGHLNFIADTLGMIIPEKEEKKAIAGIAVLLTLWAEGERKGEPIYPRIRPGGRIAR